MGSKYQKCKEDPRNMLENSQMLKNRKQNDNTKVRIKRSCRVATVIACVVIFAVSHAYIVIEMLSNKSALTIAIRRLGNSVKMPADSISLSENFTYTKSEDSNLAD
jgi:hypothetical protein